jgi:hypothetical protein
VEEFGAAGEHQALTESEHTLGFGLIESLK